MVDDSLPPAVGVTGRNARDRRRNYRTKPITARPEVDGGTGSRSAADAVDWTNRGGSFRRQVQSTRRVAGRLKMFATSGHFFVTESQRCGVGAKGVAGAVAVRVRSARPATLPTT